MIGMLLLTSGFYIAQATAPVADVRAPAWDKIPVVDLFVTLQLSKARFGLVGGFLKKTHWQPGNTVQDPTQLFIANSVTQVVAEAEPTVKVQRKDGTQRDIVESSLSQEREPRWKELKQQTELAYQQFHARVEGGLAEGMLTDEQKKKTFIVCMDDSPVSPISEWLTDCTKTFGELFGEEQVKTFTTQDRSSPKKILEQARAFRAQFGDQGFIVFAGSRQGAARLAGISWDLHSEREAALNKTGSSVAERDPPLPNEQVDLKRVIPVRTPTHR